MTRRCCAWVAIVSSTIAWVHCSELKASARAHQLSLEADWSQELQTPAAPKVVQYQSPIKRVVTLLRKMHAELEHEAKHEAEMYDKMVCWCETNEKEKAKAIQDADAKDKSLTSEIESRSARLGRVTTEIEALKKEIGELTESLKTATSIREKGAKEFSDTEISLTQALTNVKNAIIILSKHNSLLQLNSPLMMGMKTVLRDLAFKHELLTSSDVAQQRVASLKIAFISLGSDAERASVHQSQRMNRELLRALDVQAAGEDTLPLKFAERMLIEPVKDEPSAAAFLQMEKPPGPASYAPQSGVVFGMLKQLKSDFETALARAQDDEKKDVAEYEDISQGKQAQIDASKQKLDELEDENGDNLKALSDAKEDLEQTREQRSADVKFLTNLKKTCQDLDNQWQARSKTRSEELTAVAEALAIITKDDNADVLRSSVTLLQLQAKRDFEGAQRSNVASVLRNAFDGASDLLSAWEGRHKGSLHVVRVASDSFVSSHKAMAALTVRVQIDSFTKIKASIDSLASELKKQQKTEVEFKARCVKDLNANKKMLLKKSDEKDDLEASLEQLATHLDTLTKEISDARDQIAETDLEVKKASQNRETENAQFQTTVADQRATQEILKKALAKLEAFYKSSKKQDFLQMQELQVPPAQFSAYNKNAGSSPVISMLESIIQDSAQLEHECTEGEKKAQAEYVKFVKDSNTLTKTLSDAIVEKTKEIAGTKSKVADSKGDLESTKGEIHSLGKVEDDLHDECDFVLKKFEIRQTARAKEIEALHAAKAILSTGTVRS